MTEMEKLVALCQQLQMGAKTPVQGKTATFQKVLTLRFCVSICFLVCLCIKKQMFMPQASLVEQISNITVSAQSTLAGFFLLKGQLSPKVHPQQQTAISAALRAHNRA